MLKEENKLEKIVSLCKRRGFIFPGSEIYGGLANSYDYGHLGNELFNNIASLWWKKFVQERDDMIGVRGAVIMNPKVWEASGHLQNFTDPMVECRICHERFRSDKTEDLTSHALFHKQKSDDVAELQLFTEQKNFNLLFKTFIGATEDSAAVAYLRGELAQTMFTDFNIILETSQKNCLSASLKLARRFVTKLLPVILFSEQKNLRLPSWNILSGRAKRINILRSGLILWRNL
jgi:glycyl-tRNA synthetase